MAEFLNVMSNALMVYWLPSSSGFPAFPHDNLPGWQHMRFRLFFTRWATIVHQLVHRNKFRFASHRPGESSNATRSPDWFNNICSLKEKNKLPGMRISWLHRLSATSKETCQSHDFSFSIVTFSRVACLFVFQFVYLLFWIIYFSFSSPGFNSCLILQREINKLSPKFWLIFTGQFAHHARILTLLIGFI